MKIRDRHWNSPVLLQIGVGVEWEGVGVGVEEWGGGGSCFSFVFTYPKLLQYSGSSHIPVRKSLINQIQKQV